MRANIGNPPAAGSLFRLSVLALLCLVLSAGLCRADQAQSTNGGQPATQIQRLEQAFTQGRAEMHLRTFFFDRDYDSGALERTLAVGGWLSLRTAEFHGLSAGVSIATAQPFIYDDQDHGGGGVLPQDQSGITVFNEAYLQFALGKSKFSIYRQVLDTPYLDHEDDRLIPTTYEAYGLRDNTFKHASLEAFYVNGIKLQDSGTFQSMTAAAGIQGHDEGLFYFGGTYAPEENRFVQAFNYYCIQYMSTFYLEADYAIQLPAGFVLIPAVQYMDQRSVGEEVGGTFNTYAVGGKAQLNWEGFSLVLAYDSVGRDYGMQQPWSDYPGFTGMVELDNKQAGMDSWMLAAGWQKVSKEFGQIDAWAYYSYAYAPEKGGNSSPQQKEFDVVVTYQPPFLRDLGVTLKYVDLDQDEALGGGTSQEFHLLVDWGITLL